ncbi:nucleotidyl transferase AbiEii/AbiGii toxin family protein [Catenulispora pinisilvae]|uniref:nucleotidyl transferase AbiEii/AbiGii toxin family protein n=1 Tax=Catenulispora pinisilvae TaxID=2705253 RepID=UPI002B26B227|nr:nucleotidyl transferase AbiEii/AbiGii toxin family protein [Catenulispora pinisilvae]
MTDPGPADAADTCHRLVLDHVLALIAGAECGDQLVLRGSMLMTAYAGSAARKPADLDFVVVQDGWPVDESDPYPYVDELATVQQWPEVADGAGRARLWADAEFDTGGRNPWVSPDGLNWVAQEDWERSSPYGGLADLVRDRKDVGRGIELDPDGFDEHGDWMYSGYSSPGVRVVIPWRKRLGKRTSVRGTVSLDFSLDEPMPQRPVWTRIPRLDGEPSVIRAASAELSLAWKLLWLLQDTKDAGYAKAKDLYDAVVLAELPGMVLDGKLLRRVLRKSEGLRVRDFTVRDLADVAVDWDAFDAEHAVGGTVDEWLRRLGHALTIA